MEPMLLIILKLIIILKSFYCLIISERCQLDDYSMCFVTAVEHPGHFWIQKIPCSQDYSVDPLDLLIKEMNGFYNSHIPDVGSLFHLIYLFCMLDTGEILSIFSRKHLFFVFSGFLFWF